ncbi:MAG: hypothetical protein PWQ96_646 [Clostridia bacterium]|jgi:hypothetical protein|nr:hypothetical protein [Clostridiales bacterium]MDK2985004.1 hypothetical protein [Clostridia bacterium]
MKAIFTLTSSESKRLLAKAVCQLPEVKKALEKGKVVVSGGTTNGFVAEELLGEGIDKAAYTAGIITKGRQCLTPAEERINPVVLEDGKKSSLGWAEAVEQFTADDVFIKGGNALDHKGNVGVLLANPVGGTIGKALGIVTARGSHLILPVGLEKLIPDVIAAANVAGIQAFDRHIGMKVGLMPVSYGKVITEIEALHVLTGVKATCIGAGGVGGSEGSVVLAVEGEKDQVDKTMELIKSIKGEKEIRPLKQKCSDCGNKCEYGA